MAKKEEEAERPQFEGMILSTWKRLCTALLGGFYKKKARADKELRLNLARGNIRIMPEVYKSTVLVSSVLSFVISFGILVVFFAPEIGVIDLYENIQDPASEKSCIVWRYWNPELIDKNLDGGGCPEYYTQEFSSTWKFGLISGLLFAVPYLATKHFRGTAKRACKRRGAALEKFLPYAASYTAAMAASNATPMKIFRSLAQNEEIYGDIAYDAAMIYRDITLLGMDLVTAIKLAVDRSASQWGTDFFQGMVGTLSSGGDLKLYFLNRAEHYMRENRIRLTIFLETLAMLAESYVVVAVAMPLFLMVMLVIMFWVSGSGSQMDESFLYLIVMGMLPAIHIAYCGLIWMMSEEQKM